MDRRVNHLAAYLHLARASALRRRPAVRDKLLVLAAALANELQLPDVAQQCRDKILAHNAHHLVGRWPCVADAVGDQAFQSLATQLRRQYSSEKAEQLLDQLGIERGREHELYADAHEYALALVAAVPG